MRRTRRLYVSRKGATAVEAALILPIFFAFVFAIFEFGHAQLVGNALKRASRDASRLGATEGISTQDVIDRVLANVSSAVDPSKVTVLVRDAGVFDSGGSPPQSQSDFFSLPELELTEAEPRQLFVVRVTVPYNTIAPVPVPWLGNLTLFGQTVTRHE